MASVVHDLPTNDVNVFVSKFYPNGLIFGGAYIRIYGGARIRDVNWVSYLGGIYLGDVLTGFYGILFHVYCLSKWR